MGCAAEVAWVAHGDVAMHAVEFGSTVRGDAKVSTLFRTAEAWHHDSAPDRASIFVKDLAPSTDDGLMPLIPHGVRMRKWRYGRRL